MPPHSRNQGIAGTPSPRRAHAWLSTFRGESGSLRSCGNTVFLRSLRAFRLRSACHIQFYYPRLLRRWSLAAEVHCWDVSASRSPWRTCILQRGVGCSQLRWALLQACAPAFSPSEGRDQPAKVHCCCEATPVIYCSDESGHECPLWRMWYDQSHWSHCLLALCWTPFWVYTDEVPWWSDFIYWGGWFLMECLTQKHIWLL